MKTVSVLGAEVGFFAARIHRRDAENAKLRREDLNQRHFSTATFVN